MADNEQIIRDALITLFEADADTQPSGTYNITKWWRRAEDGIYNKRTPFGYVEFQERIVDEAGSDINNVGYFFVYEIGILANAGSKNSYKADDNVTVLLDKIEDVLLENRTVSGSVDDLAIPIEKEFSRGRLPEGGSLYQDISWGIIRVAFTKKITARQ